MLVVVRVRLQSMSKMTTAIFLPFLRLSFFSLFISLFPVTSSSLRCSILAGTSSKKQVPDKEPDVLAEKIKDDKPCGGPSPASPVTS